MKKVRRMPMQPVHFDEHEVVRFVPNRIVEYLLARSGIAMNQLSIMAGPAGWTKQEQAQLAQLIGYSVSGFFSLHYVPNLTAGRALKKANAYVEKHRPKCIYCGRRFMWQRGKCDGVNYCSSDCRDYGEGKR